MARSGGWAVVLLVCMVSIEAMASSRPKPPPSDPSSQFEVERVIALPGRGLSLAWAPDGSAIAVGGHLVERETGLRYDTRVYSATTGTFLRSFDCHYYWVVANTWSSNPYLGNVLVSGGGDHAVKLWNAVGPGSTRCNPGQFRAEDGGIKQLQQIDGWTTGLAFSPDGRFLAGVSRDRMVRIWQVAPGPHQFRVVLGWYDRDAGNFLSVAWLPDGTGIVTGDRRGRIAVWPVDMDLGRWTDETIADFARQAYEGQTRWFVRRAEALGKTPAWIDGGHRQVWTVRVAPDGGRVAGAGADGTVSVLNVSNGSPAWQFVLPGGQFHGMDWHPGGATIAAGGSNGVVHVFDAATGDELDRLVGHADGVAAVAWSPDGQRLATAAGGPRISMAYLRAIAGPDMTVRLWRRR